MLEKELLLVRRLCKEADKIALHYFQNTDLFVTEKPGNHGPVTLADQEIDAMISSRLSEAFPEDGILTEEASLKKEGTSGRRWLVDPIDGTRSFVEGREDFAVMIGLAVDGAIQLGIVHAPATQITTWGVVGVGAFEQIGDQPPTPIQVSACDEIEAAIALRSRSHPSEKVSAVFSALNLSRWIRMGSCGLKGVEVAAGRGELYLNLSSYLSLWDSAAPGAILIAAGGHLSDAFGRDIDYRQSSPSHLHGVVMSNANLHETITTASTLVQEKS